MIVVVHVVARVGQEVPAIVIIDEAVLVVINAVVGDLMMIHPDVALQIWVRIVYARVYHTHYDSV